VLTGTTIYKVIEPGKNLSWRDNHGERGRLGRSPFHEQIAYQKGKAKTHVRRQITDSRGFIYSQSGTIGGGSGRHLQPPARRHAVSPTTAHSRPPSRQTIRTMSPFNYKVADVRSRSTKVPYKNYGNPWWRKDTTPSK